MSTEKRKKPAGELINKKFILPRVRKQITSLESEVITLRKTKKEYISVFPRLEFFNEMRGYWTDMPFIPQDMGFEHQTVKHPKMPNFDVYHKDGWGCMKTPNNEWLFQKDDQKMSFKIKNRFDAFMALRLLGISPEKVVKKEVVSESESNKNP